MHGTRCKCHMPLNIEQCHRQPSTKTKNKRAPQSTYNSAGSSVGSLAPPRSTPPGHPAAGGRCAVRGAVVSCVVPVPPSLAPLHCQLPVLHSPCARPAFGWGSKPPFRSALAPVGVLPVGPNALPVSSFFYPRDSRFVFRGSWRLQTRVGAIVLPRSAAKGR
jgi:hypothetical protein